MKLLLVKVKGILCSTERLCQPSYSALKKPVFFNQWGIVGCPSFKKSVFTEENNLFLAE